MMSEALTHAIADRVRSMQESATIASARKSRELKEEGYDVVSLSLGEPDFNAPEFIKDAVKQAVDDDFSHYTPVNGFADLRAAICRKLERDNGLHFTPNQVVVSTGAKQCIANIAMALLNPGDEVLLPAPYWVSYAQICELAGARVVTVPTGIESDYKMSPEQLRASLTDRTRVLLFSSPCNPTGTMYSREELEAWAEVLRDFPRVTVVSDEIYELIAFDERPFSIGAVKALKDRVVTVNGLSKGFAMTGYRLGYMAAPQPIADACNKLQGQFTSGTNAVTQRAAIVAMETDPAALNDMREAFRNRRDYLLSELQNTPGIRWNRPGGAFYLFPDVTGLLGTSAKGKKIGTSADFCDYLLEEYHLATVAGEAFGAPGHVRMSYAASMPELEKAVARIKMAVKDLMGS